MMHLEIKTEIHEYDNLSVEELLNPKHIQQMSTNVNLFRFVL